MESKKILILNMGNFMQKLVDSIKNESDCEIIIAQTVDEAVQKLRVQQISGAIIAFHPQVNPETSMGISSGLEMWRRVVKNVDRIIERIPIVVTVETPFFNTTIEMQMKRYAIQNPYIIISGKEYPPEVLESILKHLGVK